MSMRYAEFRVASWLSRLLPAACAFGLAERLAEGWCQSSPQQRAIVQRNLSMIAGSRPEEPRAEACEVFRNFGRYLVEFFSVHRMQHPEVRIEGREHLLRAQQRRRGAIILTGHLGNWEVGGVLIRRMGFPMNVVALPHEDPGLDRLFNRQRERSGLRVIPLGSGAAHRCLERLRHGELLGLLGDWEFTNAGLPVFCCGRQVMLPRGPAILSLRSQAPIVPTFLLREGAWKFRLRFEPPIWPDAPARQLTQRFASILEGYLKQFAAQWVIFKPLEGLGG